MSWFRQALTGAKKFLPSFSKRQDSVHKYEATLKTYKPRETKPVDAQSLYLQYLAALHSAAEKVYKKYRLEREAWAKRPKVVVQDIVRLCPGGRHAWVMSNVGLIRKPYSV